MDQFNSLYIVWTLEPDYAKKYFYNIYNDWDDFIIKLKPTEKQIIMALEILK